MLFRSREHKKIRSFQFLQYFLILMYMFGFYKVQYLKETDKIILILLVFISGAIHFSLLFNWTAFPLFELSFILLFFLTNTGIAIFFIYHAKPPLLEEEDQKVVSFELFIQQYGITARESEVVMEI